MTHIISKYIKNINKKSFTLVELIVTITILAVLGVVITLTLSNQVGSARDSQRLKDIKNIEKSLIVNYSNPSTQNNYPMPDNVETVSGEDGETLWHQGVFGTGTLKKVNNLSSLPTDPSGSEYEYSVIKDQEQYELYAKLENKDNVSILIDQAYAKQNKYIKKIGNYDGESIKNKNGKLYINVPSIYMYSGTNLTSSGNVNYLYKDKKRLNNSTSNVYSYNIKKMPDGKTWTTEFVKHGTKLTDMSDTPTYNNNNIEKWCPNNNKNNCISSGALYNFPEAMGIGTGSFSSTGNKEDLSESICSDLGKGWHIPSDQDLQNLESSLGCSNFDKEDELSLTDIRPYDRCLGLGWTGNKLGGTISSLAGFRHPTIGFSEVNPIDGKKIGLLGTSTDVGSGTKVRGRQFKKTTGIIDRGFGNKKIGASFLCVKN